MKNKEKQAKQRDPRIIALEDQFLKEIKSGQAVDCSAIGFYNWRKRKGYL